MPSFILSYSPFSIDRSLDLMDVTNYFVKAHSFKRTHSAHDYILEMIVAVNGAGAMEVAYKSGALDQILADVEAALPPQSLGPPLFLWAKFGNEEPWSTWTIRKAETAPMDFAVRERTIEGMHVRLTVSPMTTGDTFTTNLSDFIRVPGDGPGLGALALTRYPEELAKLYVGVRGHKNLQPRDFQSYYAGGDRSSVAAAWQKMASFMGAPGPFNSGVFDCFVEVSDEALWLPAVRNLQAVLATGTLTSGFYEYLQTGWTGSVQSPASNVANILLGAGATVISSDLKGLLPRNALGGKLRSVQSFAVDLPASPVIVPNGLQFDVSSDGWIMQDKFDRLLILPGVKEGGYTGLTNKKPPKVGELGYTFSTVRMPLPVTKATTRTVSVQVDIEAFNLGALASPIFFPLTAKSGVFFDAFGWRFYRAGSEDIVTEFKDNKLHTSPMTRPLSFGPNALTVEMDWALGFLRTTLLVGGVSVAVLITLELPDNEDVVLGIFASNALPEQAFTKIVNPDPASWSFTKVALMSSSSSKSTSMGTSSGTSSSSSHSASSTKGSSDGDSHSNTGSGSTGSNDNGSSGDSHSKSTSTFSGHGDGSTNTDADSTHEIDFTDFPVVGEILSGSLPSAPPLLYDPSSPITKLVTYGDDPIRPVTKFFKGPAQVTITNSANASADGQAEGDSSISDGGDISGNGGGGHGDSGGSSRSSSRSQTQGDNDSQGNQDSSSGSVTTSSNKSDSSSSSITTTDGIDFDIPLAGLTRTVIYKGIETQKTISSSDGKSSSNSGSQSLSTSSSNEDTSSHSSGKSDSSSNSGEGQSEKSHSGDSSTTKAEGVSDSAPSGSGKSDSTRTDTNFDKNTNLPSTRPTNLLVQQDPRENTEKITVKGDDSYTGQYPTKSDTVTTFASIAEQLLGGSGSIFKLSFSDQERVSDKVELKDQIGAPMLPVTQAEYMEAALKIGLVPDVVPITGVQLILSSLVEGNSAPPLPGPGWSVGIDHFSNFPDSWVLVGPPGAPDIQQNYLGGTFWNGVLGVGAEFYSDALRSTNITKSHNENDTSSSSHGKTNTNGEGGSSSDSNNSSGSKTSGGGGGDSSANGKSHSESEGSSLSSSTNTQTSGQSSESKSSSVSLVFQIRPLIPTIVPFPSFSVARAVATFSNLVVTTGPETSEAVLLSWTPQPGVSRQTMYRRIDGGTWQHHDLNADDASLADNGALAWQDGDPPDEVPGPTIFKLRINDIIETAPMPAKQANGFLIFSPVVLAPVPSQEPEATPSTWSIDVYARNSTATMGTVKSLRLLPHDQAQARSMGPTVHTNRFGQTGPDAEGRFELSAGNNIVVLVGEDAQGQPVDLSDVDGTVTITPQAHWLQALE